MTDIIVTLPVSEGGLVHLGEKAIAYEYNEIPYWDTKINLREIGYGDKCFILTESAIRGYFIINDFEFNEYVVRGMGQDPEENHGINFVADSWRDIHLIEKRGFQGVRYKRKKNDFKYTVLGEK